MEFSSDIRLINLELFDAAFPIAPDESDAVQRRFMTLFAQDSRTRRGGSGEVLKVLNAQGEAFALKRLRVAKSQEGSGNDGTLDARADGRPDVRADDEPDAHADGKPDARADGESDARTGGKPGVRADDESDVRADGELDVHADDTLDACVDDESDARTDGKLDVRADDELDAHTGGKPIVDSDNESFAGADASTDRVGAAVDAKRAAAEAGVRGFDDCATREAAEAGVRGFDDCATREAAEAGVLGLDDYATRAAAEAGMLGFDDYATREAAVEDIAANRKKVLRNSISASGARGSTAETPDYVTQGHVAAFYEEYRVQLAVSNLRGFPRVYGFGFSDGNPVIVMEWVEGTTLREAMRGWKAAESMGKSAASGTPMRAGAPERTVAGDGRSVVASADRPPVLSVPAREGAPEHTANGDDSVDSGTVALLPLEAVANLGIAVLELLARASELDERFVHRDISPRNIMLRGDRIPPAEQLRTGDFDLCLLDFGSSVLLAPGNAADPTFTMNANIWRMGTPAYAPPEMLSADVELPAGYRQSPTIDTYALCSVLYELYAGRKPYRITPHDEVSPYRLKTETAPDALEPRDPDGGALAGAIMTGLSPQQDDRPGVVELKTALENWKAFPEARAVGALRGAKPADRSMWQPGYARKAFTRRAVVAAGIVAVGAVVAGIVVGSKKPSRVAAVDPARYEIAGQLYAGEPLFKALDGRHPGWMLCSAEGDIVCKPASSRECGALREGLVALYDDMSQLYGYVTPVAGANVAGAAEGGAADVAGARNGAGVKNSASAKNGAGAKNGANAKNSAGASGYAWYILPAFAQAADFSESLAAAQDADTKLWGFIGTSGTWAIEPRFRAAGSFSNGVASAQANDADMLWGAVDATGTWVIDPQFVALGARSAEGFAAAQDDADGWGIVDARGRWTSDVRFLNLRQIGDYRPAVDEPDADSARGALALAPALDEATGLWGYVDPSCAWIIAPTFRDAHPFCEGLAAVQDAKTQLWYFIMPDGSPHGGMEPRFWKLGDLHDGLAPAQASAEDSVVFDESDPDARSEFAGMRYGYVDAAGEWQMKRLTTLVDTAIR